MATENIVLLTCAAVLCTLHVVGGPLSGIFRSPPPSKRRDAHVPRESAPPAPMASAPEGDAISRASSPSRAS